MFCNLGWILDDLSLIFDGFEDEFYQIFTSNSLLFYYDLVEFYQNFTCILLVSY